MTRFKHIIITRFNLPKRWDADKKGKAVLDTVWLNERFVLFENFCLPSIIGQTSQNFEWWVYFDNELGMKFRKRVEELSIDFPNFKPKFEKSYDDFELNMPKKIYNYLKILNIDWLITTRLDNDDMLAKNTIELIQRENNFQNNSILEIPTGYTLELVKPPKIRKISGMLNPFITYIENIKEQGLVKSVYYYEHTEWKNVNCKIITKKPQWVQIIHEKNVFNRAIGELVSPLNFNSKFVFNKDFLNRKIPLKLLTKNLLKQLKIETFTRKIIKFK